MNLAVDRPTSLAPIVERLPSRDRIPYHSILPYIWRPFWALVAVATRSLYRRASWYLCFQPHLVPFPGCFSYSRLPGPPATLISIMGPPFSPNVLQRRVWRQSTFFPKHCLWQGFRGQSRGPPCPDQLLVIFCSLAISMTCMRIYYRFILAQSTRSLAGVHFQQDSGLSSVTSHTLLLAALTSFSSRHSARVGPLYSVKTLHDRVFSAPELCVDNLPLLVQTRKLYPF